MSFRVNTPVVLSFGDEDFFLDRDLNWLRRYPGRDVLILDGASVNDSQIVSACESLSIDMNDPDNIKPRLVVVDNAHKVKTDKQLKPFLASRQKGSKLSALAAICRSEKLPAVWSKVPKDVVTLREHKKLKTWDNNNEVVKWSLEEAKRLGFELDSKAALVLFQVTGGDLYQIANELSKLLLLVGKGKKAEVAQLAQIVSATSGATPWKVVDHALAKDRKKALNSLNSLYRFASEEPSILLLATLMKGVETLFLARSMVDQGLQAEDIAARLKMHPFRYSKTVQVQVRKHDLGNLSRLMQRISKLDVELKRTSHRRMLVELVVLDVSS